MTQFGEREFEIWCLGLRFLLGIFLHTFLGPFLNELEDDVDVDVRRHA